MLGEINVEKRGGRWLAPPRGNERAMSSPSKAGGGLIRDGK